ncbi:MAG TPA: sensor histidine kinase [Flavisolibacter sp.]
MAQQEFNSFQNKGYHFLFWLMTGGVWFYLRYQDYESLLQAMMVTAIKVADLALVIYLVNLLLVPLFLYRKKYVHFSIAFVGLVATSSFIKLMIVREVLNGPLATTNLKEAIYNNFVTQFFLVLASIALKSAFDYIRLQKRLADVAKEKAEAELNFLKAQINPHFLFNSLNSVYFLIDKNNVQAREALHKFSEMLRYQLYECGDKRIPIEKEIDFLKDYVDLQQLRVNENTSIEFTCDKEIGRFSIEPLLLIPFVENSFKHLSHFSHKQNEVQIKLARQNGSVQFSVYNTTEPKTDVSKSGGIGLANVQKRLELLYPGKHVLEVTNKEGWFGIQLSLSVNH